MKKCQAIFNLLTQENMEEVIREARKRLGQLQKQGRRWEYAVLKRELNVFEGVSRELCEFGDYRVDSAGVVWKKEKP